MADNPQWFRFVSPNGVQFDVDVTVDFHSVALQCASRARRSKGGRVTRCNGAVVVTFKGDVPFAHQGLPEGEKGDSND